MRWWRALAILCVAGAFSACKKDINTKEAVQSAIVGHLSKVSASTGLDMARMSVDVTTVSFQEDKAEATVAFGLKDGGQGMQMNYSLTRKGDVWEVKPRAAGGAHGGASPLPPPSSPAMPPGHPPTGANQ